MYFFLWAFVFASSIFSIYQLKRFWYSTLTLLPKNNQLNIKPCVKNKYSPQNPEIIIIGAGVAGCSLAKALADQNRQVTIIERNEVPPPRIVAEYLQPGGKSFMKNLGIADCLEGIDAVSSVGYVMLDTMGNNTLLPYPKSYSGKEIGNGVAFHNDRFLAKIRNKLQNEYKEKITIIKANVESLIVKDNYVHGVEYKAGDKIKCMYAPLTVVCDGCFSKFRKLVLSPKCAKTVTSSFAGLILKNANLPYEGYGHVFLLKESPVLMYRISSTEVRVLIDIPTPVVLDYKDYILNTVVPQVPLQLAKLISKAVEASDNIKIMPNFRMATWPSIMPGVVAIGDSINIRHPLTGGGMTVCLSDVCTLSSLLSNIQDFADSKSVMNAYRKFFRVRTPLASTINILAHALYRILAGPHENQDVSKYLKHACQQYLNSESNREKPLLLLSGVLDDPLQLVYCYVKVGLFSAWAYKCQPIVTAKMLFTVIKIIVPLICTEIYTKLDYNT